MRILALTCALIGALVLACATAGSAEARRSCSAKPSRAGDWPQPGRDLGGSRWQPRERSITPEQAKTLAPAWTFYTGHPSGGSSFSLDDLNNTPVEAGGCLYFGSAVSAEPYPNVFALDVRTGKPVWQRHLAVEREAIGGAVVGAPAVVGKVLYVLVNTKGDGASAGPYAAALDRRTGKLLWRSEPLVTETNSFTNASVVVVGGVLLAGFSGEEGDADAHGGLALIEARTGKLLSRTFSIPQAEWVGADGQHYGGGGVWTTPAVDRRTGYAFMGTGNPFSKKSEHPNTNAIIKIDVRRGRSTFGQIVGSYKGTIDQSSDLVEAITRPSCEVMPDGPLQDVPQEGDPRLAALQGVLGDSPTCGQLDLDFGGAPNLFRDGDGRLIVGELQKSGVYHAVYADTMQRAWIRALGSSCHVCNGASTAFDRRDRSIYADVSPGSLMASIDTQGGLNWYTPAADIFHYPAVSVAGGVVYTVDNGARFLDAFDAESGALILLRSLSQDGAPEAPTLLNSAGVTIARHTVFVPAGSHIIAYRPAASR